MDDGTRRQSIIPFGGTEHMAVRSYCSRYQALQSDKWRGGEGEAGEASHLPQLCLGFLYGLRYLWYTKAHNLIQSFFTVP